MNLSQEQLNRLVDLAGQAAVQAGRYIQAVDRDSLQISHKKTGSSAASQVVSNVDRACESIILQQLLPTCAELDLAWLSEEQVGEDGEVDDKTYGRLHKPFFWCIDPLDGTLPFVNDEPGYAVSIALVSRQGVAKIGVVYDPISEVLYQAIDGQGLCINGKAHAADAPGNPDYTGQTLRLMLDRSYRNVPVYETAIHLLEQRCLDAGLAGLELQVGAGGVMNACKLLQSSPGCYFKFPKPTVGGGGLWDFAATACLLKEAGAVVGDIYGNPLDLNRTDSHFMNHRGVLYASDSRFAKMVIDIFQTLG